MSARAYHVHMKDLSPKEKELLSFIEDYQLENGASPTVREMRVHMKLKSDGFVVHCLKRLREKGVIEKNDTPRGIKLLSKVRERLHGDFVRVPVLGSIPAGGPVISEENIEEWISIDAKQFQRRADETFILRVWGESMVGAGIFEGDYVLVAAKKEPRNNDIVVALADGGSTLKRVKIEKNDAYLKAENPSYSDIRPLSELTIQGVVIGLFRWY